MDDSWREIEVEWCGGSTFIGKNKAGGTVQMGMLDGKPGVGPMELLLTGLAGCTGDDIVSILTKKRQPLKDLKIKVRGKRATTYPMVYKEIEVIYLLWGNGLESKAVEQAIELSEEKYCSVRAMLSSVAKITSSYQLLNEE